VLILIAMLAEARLAVVAAAFTIAILPITTNVIAGEVVRLREAPFVQAARALGVSESRIIIRHIIPNVVAVLGPLFLQILGAAIAIDGAIGLLGLGNRTQLDIGILLLRGKENALLFPHLLIGVIATIFLIYCWLFLLIRTVSQKSSVHSSFLFS
jgi:peptide/nickel transport system permease protein